MKIAAILLTALLSPALFAQANLDAMLDDAAKVKRGESADWITKRDAIVALGEDAVPALREAGKESAWTSDGWVRAMVAEACRLRITNNELAVKADKPRGIDPQWYVKNRMASPTCQQDLNKLGRDAVPLLLERWRFTFDAYPFSEGEAGNRERSAYACAIFYVPGNIGDQRARFALEGVLRDVSLTDHWRQVAAVSLGQTGGTDALTILAELYDDAKQQTAVREGCAWAFGRVADIQAAETIESRLTADGLSNELRRALLTGVAILGSSWTWKARGVMHKASGDEIREKCARMAFDVLKTSPKDLDMISRALNMTAWEDSLQWVEDLAENGETKETKYAAKECIEPLQTAINRDKD